MLSCASENLGSALAFPLLVEAASLSVQVQIESMLKVWQTTAVGKLYRHGPTCL